MEALCSYLPASILSYLLEREGQPIQPPLRQSYKTAVLFADISGYTALCEAVASKGAGGDEYLARHLNSYFEQLVKIMSSQGGDVLKFAGDAVIVLWPPSADEDLRTLTRRAAQCGLEIKRGLQNVKLAEGITLSVKIGVGVGEVSILHVGGVFGRTEYLATGSPLIQAFHAEHHCEKPDVVVSPEAWDLIRDYFEAEINDRHAFLRSCVGPLKKISVFKTTSAMRNIKESVLKNVGKYVPSAVLPFIAQHEEKWASELRRITVLFVNLGLKEKDMNEIATNVNFINVIHDVLQAVQTAVYKYEGSLNKFLMDDKGSTLVAVFGLPPLAHEDDSVRGVLSSLAICAKLHELGYHPSIGVTTGNAFCGVVGSRGRREYSVLGDTVNLSARLMQHATKQGGGVICDTSTQYSARHRLHFEDNGKIVVKGKVKPVLIWQPYSAVLAPLYYSADQRAAAAATAAAEALESPSSPSSVSIDGSVVDPTSISPKNAILNSNMVLVDDETLHLRHLRRKSLSLDPFQLVRAAGTPTQSSSSSQHTEKTSDTIDASMVERVAGGAPTGAAVDQVVAEGVNSESVSTSRRSTTETRAAIAISADAASLALQPALQNTPQLLMLDIHNFQAEGSVKRHFALLRSRKEGLTTRVEASNSMDAALLAHSHTWNAATAKRVADLTMLPSTVPSLTSPPHVGAAAVNAFNAHLPWFESPAQFDNVLEGLAPMPEDFARVYPERAVTKRVRGVRVILPDGLGALAMSTLHLESVLQLKEELSIICRKRMLLPLEVCNAAFFLTLENDKLWLTGNGASSGSGSNNAAVDDLSQEIDSPSANASTMLDDVLGPLLDRQRAAATLYREQHKSSPLSPSGVHSPTPASPIPEEPISPNGTSTALPVVTQGDLLTLCMCRSTADYLLDVLPRKFHDILLHAVEVRLLQERRGGTIVLEGDVGLGKTHLMMGALSSAQRSRPDSLTLLTTLANPFEMNKPLSSWRDIFLSAIDGELDRLSESEADSAAYPGGSTGNQSQVRANRRKFVESKLQLRRSVGREGLHLFAAVLNDVLQLDFKETDLTRSLDPAMRTAHAQNLLLVLMQMFLNPGASGSFGSSASAGGSSPRGRTSGSNSLSGGAPAVSAPSIIVCIDDAVFLDTASWSLVLQMSRQLSGLLLILSTRPINRTYQAAFVSGGVPKDYLALLTDPQTTHLVMRSRTDAVIDQIACEAFAAERNDSDDDAIQMVRSSSSSAPSPLINCPPKGRLLPTLPPALAHLILKKAHGSPLVVLEVVYNLIKDKLVTLTRETTSAGITTLHLQLDSTFNVAAIHNNPLIPVPITLQNILGCRIDRLTHSQRMILKVGAVIGDEFPFRLISSVYPLSIDGDPETSLRREVRGLVELHILQVVEPTGEALLFDDDGASLAYAFTDGFMREMFLSRMLDNQKTALEEKVSESRLEYFKKKHERINKSLVPFGGTRAGSIGPFVTPVMTSVMYVRDNPPPKPKSRMSDEDESLSAGGPSSVSSSSPSLAPASASSTSPPLEYRLRYFALCASMLFGWVTEEAFLERKEPICVYSLEQASTCEDPSRELGFALRSMVSLDRFSTYTPSPVVVRFAALNEKDYEAWGVKLHEYVEDKLILASDDTTVVGATPPPIPGAPLGGIMEEGSERIKPRAGSIHFQVNPLLAVNSNGSPHTSFSIPSTPAHALAEEAKPILVDINSLTPSERETWGKKFISAVENRMAPQIMPPALLAVRKYRGEKITTVGAGGTPTKGGSLFSSEWKQRYVTLIDESLVLRDKKFGAGYAWTKPNQAFSLQVGSPQAIVASAPSEVYDSARKVYKLTLEVDMWMKAGVVAWSRRSVVIGCTTFEEAKNMADRLNELIFKNQVALTQAKQKHQRASTWGIFKGGQSGRKIVEAGVAPPRSSNALAMNPMARPLPRTTVPPPKAGGFVSSKQVSIGAKATDADQDRKLRASQRQLSTGSGLNVAASAQSDGSVAPPPTPASAATASSLPSPSGLPVDKLAVFTPSTSSTSLHHSTSPMYPTTPTPSTNGNGQAAEETVSSPNAVPQGDEEQQLDQLFSETMQAMDNGSTSAPVDPKNQLASLRHKVKALTKANRVRAVTAAVTAANVARSASTASAVAAASAAATASATAAAESAAAAAAAAAAASTPTPAVVVTPTVIVAPVTPAAAVVVASATPIAIDESEESSSAIVIAPSQPIPLSLCESTFGDLTSWEWCIFDHATDSSQLLPIVFHIFSQFGFLKRFGIRDDVFQAWAAQVHLEYFENPFHNFYHAVDVLQTVCVMITRFGAGELLTTLDQFALCTAALCHDLRHPGTTNAFHVNARTPLALLYNDQSVLEHHHAASTFRILEKPAFNILSSLPTSEYRAVRSRLTLGILATDMSAHWTLIDKFAACLDELTGKGKAPAAKVSATSGALTATPLTDAHRGVIFNVVLHACDISNPSKPWATQRKWSDALLSEFLHQGDMERAKGLPVSANCDRATTEQTTLALSFIDDLVTPLLARVYRALPRARIMWKHLTANRALWAEIKEGQASADEKQAEKKHSPLTVTTRARH